MFSIFSTIVTLCAFHACVLATYNAEDGVAHILEVSPAGPIQAALGTNLTINCTTNQAGAGPGNATLRWHVPDYGQQQDRFTTSWYARSTLELLVRNLIHQDAGEYTCLSAHHGTRKVLVEVLPITPEPVTMVSDTLNLLLNVHLDPDGCSEKQFRCANGHCIFKTYHCDNIPDCLDASDEEGCDHGCAGRFRCDNGQCIALELRCDKFHVGNCRDRSDEKNCDNQQFHEFVNLSDQDSDHPVMNHEHESWHFNAIYSAVAGVVGLVCVVAIVVITVCRIHLQREALRQMSRDRTQDLHRVVTLSRPTHRNVPSSLPSSVRRVITVGTPDQYFMESYFPPNVSLNINLHLSPPGGLSEMSALMPPPYSEVDELPHEDLPPPPYTASDAQADLPNVSTPTISPPDYSLVSPMGGVTPQITECSSANTTASDVITLPNTDLVRAGSASNEGHSRSEVERNMCDNEETTSLLNTEVTTSR